MSGVGYVVKGMIVDLDGERYECEITSVAESESHDVQTSRTACPTGGAITDVSPSSFTVDVEANVDVATGSLYRLLTDPANSGAEAELTWHPDLTNNPNVSRVGTVRLVPPAGTFPVGDWAAFSVSLPVVGALTWDDATPPPADADADALAAEADDAALIDA